MTDSDDDPDLKEAIALSLQGHDSNSLGALNNPIDVDINSASSTLSQSQNQHLDQPRLALNTMLGLDRKTMEEERLARKRKAASITPPPLRKAAKIVGFPIEDREDATRVSTEAGRNSDQRFGASESSEPSESTTQLSSSPPTNSRYGGHGVFPVPHAGAPHFLHGVVKKTWSFHHSREGNDIKIEEVLQSSSLHLAVLSSFQWDMEWLFSKLDTRKTKMILVMEAKDEATKAQYRRETADINNLGLCFPSMEGGVNCMHSKLMLLSHPGYLRVVVPTANLVPYDWGWDGTMENSVFLIDLPRLPEGETVEEMTFFGEELIYFLEAMDLDEKIIQSVCKFDFSATKDLAFVHTIGGMHTEETWWRTGYCGLGRAIRQLNLHTNQSLHINFVTSSIGSLTYDFISKIYLAAQGDDGTTELERRVILQGKSKKDQQIRDIAAMARQNLIDTLKTKFRIYFPTHETVASSIGGRNCGGTICFQSKWYNAESFPRDLLWDCKSTRPGMLMHNKILFVRRPDPDLSMVSKDWAYVGSANCSESAWGRLSRDRSSKALKLHCRNWECGVVVPLRRRVGEWEVPVPVPMIPGERYRGRTPWYHLEG